MQAPCHSWERTVFRTLHGVRSFGRCCRANSLLLHCCAMSSGDG
ncbi:hypothetical protein BN844_2041 [Pseudomonas sp. SHC52]|nr:hypothetical protein BN844_2041 [Pseudomonas sp. SHC52]